MTTIVRVPIPDALGASDWIDLRGARVLLCGLSAAFPSGAADTFEIEASMDPLSTRGLSRGSLSNARRAQRLVGPFGRIRFRRTGTGTADVEGVVTVVTAAPAETTAVELGDNAGNATDWIDVRQADTLIVALSAAVVAGAADVVRIEHAVDIEGGTPTGREVSILNATRWFDTLEVPSGYVRAVRVQKGTDDVQVTITAQESTSTDAGREVPGANLVTQWYVDTEDGDNLQDGLTPDTPVQDVGEVLRRIGAQVIDGITVTVAIAGLGKTDSQDWGTVHFANDGVLLLRGVRIVSATAYTLADVTNWDETSQVIGAYQLEDGAEANPNLAALAGKAFVHVHGDPAKCVGIGKDLGSGTFRGTWIDQDNDEQYEPSIGASVRIYTLPSFGGGEEEDSFVSIRAEGKGTVRLVDLDLGGTSAPSTFLTGGSGVIVAKSCILRGLLVANTTLNAYGCIHRGFMNRTANVAINGGYFVGVGQGFVTGGNGITQILFATVSAISTKVGNAFIGPGSLLVLGAFAVCDYSTNAVELSMNSFCRVTADHWIHRDSGAQTYGWRLSPGCLIEYNADTLSITGTEPTTNFLIGGTGKAMEDIPYFEAINGAGVVVTN